MYIGGTTGRCKWLTVNRYRNLKRSDGASFADIAVAGLTPWALFRVNIYFANAPKPPQAGKSKAPTVIGCGIVFILGMGFMAALQSMVLPSQAKRPEKTPPAGIDALHAYRVANRTPTQGGEFEYMPLPLEEPRAFFPDTSQPLPPPRWFFVNYSRTQVANLINACEFTQKERRRLLDFVQVQADVNGAVIIPPPELVLEMSRTARQRIYSVLCQSSQNSAQCHPFRFRPDAFEQWCAESGLTEETLQVLRKLTYKQGNSLCFCDGAIAQGILAPEEFQRLVKSLYGERTFIMRLLITPESNIEAITRYWAKGDRVEAIRPLLESMKKIPGGAGLNISFLLPAFAETRLYTYPETMEEDDLKENCFWTAMNFFNAKPDPRFATIAHTQRALADDYYHVQERPIYGDLVVWENATGTPVHMCVYLADDVVFTKNGSDRKQPWVLMKIPDVLAYYDWRDSVGIRIYRSKKDAGNSDRALQTTRIEPSTSHP